MMGRRGSSQTKISTRISAVTLSTESPAAFVPDFETDDGNSRPDCSSLCVSDVRRSA